MIKVSKPSDPLLTKAVWPIFRRELASYFTTPLAYIFMIIFLVMSGVMTFYIGGFFLRGQADLSSFFVFHPWLYLFFIPALTMRMWAEERKAGSLELLLTMPLSLWDAIVGKFLAAWALTSLTMVLTIPIWITVNVLGNPDNGVIAVTYFASLLMAGGYIAVSLVASVLTTSQVIAFIMAAVLCFIFTFTGTPLVINFIQGWLPAGIVEIVRELSLLTHFQSMSRGVIEFSNIVFYVSTIFVFLGINKVLLMEHRR